MKKLNLLVLLLCVLFIGSIKTYAITEPALSHLEVETEQGNGIFNLGSKKVFNFGLSSTLGYANIIATPTDPSYQVSGAGKVNCTEGLNKIDVVVTDPSDNSSVTYTINLTYNGVASSPAKSYDKDGNEIENPPTGDFLNITLISLIGLGAIILINKTIKKSRFYRV